MPSSLHARAQVRPTLLTDRLKKWSLTPTLATLLLHSSLSLAETTTPPAEGAPIPSADQEEVATPQVSAPESAPPGVSDELDSDLEPQEEPESLTESAAPQAPSETPTPTETEAPTSTASTDDFDLDRKPYNRERPNWAFEMAYSPSGLGRGGTVPGATSEAARSIRGFTMQMEWQPAWIQAIGVIGIGPSLQIYPELPLGSLTSTATSLWSAGLQARYQLKFFEGQWVVPMAGYAAERVQFNVGGQKGFLIAQGPFAGIFVLLNPLEPSAAGEAYVTLGVKRTYLVAELRMREGASNAGVNVSENATFIGIRSEW